MSSAKPATSSTPAKPRSPVERTIVWGVILVLFVLLGIEGTSYLAQKSALSALLAKIKATEGSGSDVKLSDVKAAVGNKAPRVEDVTNKLLANGARRLEVYEWFSIHPAKKREMYVYYGVGEDPDVVSVSTEEDTETIAKKFPPMTPEQLEGAKQRAAEGNAKSQAEEDAEKAGAQANADAEGKPAEAGAESSEKSDN